MPLPNTPKTDWDAADAVANTDLNNIEENVEYLGQNLTFSSACGGDASISVGAGVSQSILKAGVTIPAGLDLKVRAVNAYNRYIAGEFYVDIISYTPTGLVVTRYSTTGVSSGLTGIVFITEPDSTVANNPTGGSISAVLSIGFKNTTGGALNMEPSDGFSVILGVE